MITPRPHPAMRPVPALASALLLAYLCASCATAPRDGAPPVSVGLLSPEADAASCERVTEFNAAYFELQSDVFMPGVADELAESAKVLMRCPSVAVKIRGYADPRETDVGGLSGRRAEAMQAFFLHAGVPADQIADVSGRGQDPRLDLEVVCQGDDCPTPLPPATRDDKRSRRADATPTPREPQD